ncbi:hypothetical protein B0H17DRAFT_1190425 [Mycena rosella]|uniref:Uncharacterized protein n=1 Tax=Mycena rosella TaxID=1033263 RepID=A0AAD7H356_MYCRO|nr:hypothetical protein B0H17DRAFT_1190425 [Mycena rosella]
MSEVTDDKLDVVDASWLIAGGASRPCVTPGDGKLFNHIHRSSIHSSGSVVLDTVCTGVLRPLLAPPNITCSISRSFSVHLRLLTSVSATLDTVAVHVKGTPALRALRVGRTRTPRTGRTASSSTVTIKWTGEEFAAWCAGAAKEWGWEIEELGGVGRTLEDNP